MGKWERPARPRPPPPSVGACPPPPVIRNPRNGDTATRCDQVETRGRAIMWCVGARCRPRRNHAPRFSSAHSVSHCASGCRFLKLSFAAFGGGMSVCTETGAQTGSGQRTSSTAYFQIGVCGVWVCSCEACVLAHCSPFGDTGKAGVPPPSPSRVLALIIAQCAPHGRVPGCPLYAVQPLYFGGSQGLTIFTQHTYCERKWASLEVVSLSCSSQLSGLQLLGLTATP